MNLFLWRHAQAHDEAPDGLDLSRELTPRGHEQAKKMARWLELHLSGDSLVLCSPAQRCLQTAQALSQTATVDERLAPDKSPRDIAQVAQWSLPGMHSADFAPGRSVLVVGHQPTLGQLIGMSLQCPPVSVRKAAVWWLRRRQRDGDVQTLIEAVVTPDVL
jgi:phosphohistidine phosphatase